MHDNSTEFGRSTWSLICVRAAFLLVVYLSGNPIARADVVWIKGEEQPKFGRLIDQDDQKVVFQLHGQPETNRTEFQRTAIETLVVNFDTQRLENLSPENFADYRDYAEELAAQRKDPVARELAVRLYIIAAAGSPGDIRQSSLKGLASLAENNQERQKWNTLRLLYEPQMQLGGESTSSASGIRIGWRPSIYASSHSPDSSRQRRRGGTFACPT